MLQPSQQSHNQVPYPAQVLPNLTQDPIPVPLQYIPSMSGFRSAHQTNTASGFQLPRSCSSVTELYPNMADYLMVQLFDETLLPDLRLGFLRELTEFKPKTDADKDLIKIVNVYNELINKILMDVVFNLHDSNEPGAAHANLGKWLRIMKDVRYNTAFYASRSISRS